jgi:hypothetical protein
MSNTNVQTGAASAGDDANRLVEMMKKKIKEEADALKNNSWIERQPGDADMDECNCGEKGWSWGCCDGCCDGGAVRCIQRLCCITCMYGRAVTLALEPGPCVNCCACCFCFCCGFPYCRSRLREQYGMTQGSGIMDCLKAELCTLCWLQQFVHEVNSRENVHIGPCGDPEGTWNIKCDCGQLCPSVSMGTNVEALNGGDTVNFGSSKSEANDEEAMER